MREPRADRAKQFMPFAALVGFGDAIAEKNRLTEPRRELAEDEAELLSEKLASIKEGDRVTVTYYDTDRYATTEGEVASFDAVFRILRLGKREIAIDDIIDIRPR